MTNEKPQTQRQALVIQVISLLLFGGMVWLDAYRNGELNFSPFLYLALLSIAIGVSPDTWTDLIIRIFGRNGNGKK